MADLEDRIVRDLGRVVGRVIRPDKINQELGAKEEIIERKMKPASQEEINRETRTTSKSESESESSERSSVGVEQHLYSEHGQTQNFNSIRYPAGHPVQHLS